VERSNEPARDLSWSSCFNARDLGGYETADGRRTRWRAVFRADNLGHLDAAGQATLVRDGVVTVIDLRSQSEHGMAPTHPFRAGAAGAVPRYVSVPLVDETDVETTALVNRATSRDESYRLMLDRCRGQIGAVVRTIAGAEEGGVVFHCHAGLDRTGLVAALLLGVAGVAPATIVEDYALSHERMGALYEHYVALIADPEARARFRRFTARRELMEAALAYLEAEHGGAEAYLLAAGMSGEELDRLRARLVESPPPERVGGSGPPPS
jgi:protein-tyrosine phosphatase